MPATAQNIEIEPSVSSRLINDSVTVYYTLDTLAASEVWELITKHRINKYPEKLKANSKDKNNTFWILFKLKNRSPNKFQYLINFAFTRTDVISLYEVNAESNTTALMYRTGDAYPFKQRPIDYRSFVMPVEFDAGEVKTFLLNADKRKTVDRFPIRILTESSFDRIKNGENIRYGLFFGFLATLFLGSLIASLALKKGVFIFYGAYALFIGIYLFASLGLLFQYGTSNFPAFNFYDLVLFGSWAMVFFSFYSVAFFEPYQKGKTLPLVQKGVTYLLIAIVNGSFLLSISGIPKLELWMLDRYEFVLSLNYLLILIIFCLVIISSISSMKAAGILGALLLCGILSSLVGIIYTVLVDNGLISDHLFTDNSLATLAGFLIEMCFFTVAIILIIKKNIAHIGNRADQLKLREVHHRVKNNIQTISSMMGMEAMGLNDDSAISIIDAGRERLAAISKVHQNLYLQEETDSVDIERYLIQLVRDVGELHDPEHEVKIQLELESHKLQLEQVSSIGIIVNELMINAYKYSFELISDPTLSISFSKDHEKYKLEINDNGMGIQESKPAANESFGMKMVSLLAKQLRGTITISSESGFKFQLQFAAK